MITTNLPLDRDGLLQQLEIRAARLRSLERQRPLPLQEHGKLTAEIRAIESHLAELDRIDEYMSTYQDSPGAADGFWGYAEQPTIQTQQQAISPGAIGSVPRQKTVAELETDILEAALADDPQQALTQVAAMNRLPFGLVEQYAQSLTKKKAPHSPDLERRQYEQCMREMREIELKLDPGEKTWRLAQLAKRYGMREKQLREAFTKSLITNQVESPLSRSQIQNKYGENQDWLMRGWIPASALILFHGHGGRGKTLFVNHLLKHCVTGQDWEDYKVKNPVPALYIQGDTPPHLLCSQLEQAGIGPELPIWYHFSWQVEHMHHLREWIKERGVKLVILDSLIAINKNTIISENDVEYARPLLYLREIAIELGVTFIIIHHSNGQGSVRGTTALRNSVDMVYSLEAVDEKDPSNPERLLIMDKTRFRMPMKYRLRFNDEDFSWSLLPLDEKAEPVNTGARALIQGHLLKHPGVGFCAEELAEAVRLSSATIRKELPGLVREGMIDRKTNVAGTGGRPQHLYLIGQTPDPTFDPPDPTFDPPDPTFDPQNPEPWIKTQNDIAASVPGFENGLNDPQNSEPRIKTQNGLAAKVPAFKNSPKSTFDPGESKNFQPSQSENRSDPGSKGSNGSKVGSGELQPGTLVMNASRWLGRIVRRRDDGRYDVAFNNGINDHYPDFGLRVVEEP